MELAFEDKRWWDILRWKICDGENGVMNKPIGGMKIEDTNGDGVGNTIIMKLVNVPSCHVCIISPFRSM